MLSGRYEDENKVQKEENLVHQFDPNNLSASKLFLKTVSEKSENYQDVMDLGTLNSKNNLGLKSPCPSSFKRAQKNMSKSILMSNTSINLKLNCFSIYHYSSGKVLNLNKEKIINSNDDNLNQIYTDLFEFSSSSIIKEFINADKIEKKKQIRNTDKNSKFSYQVIYASFWCEFHLLDFDLSVYPFFSQCIFIF